MENQATEKVKVPLLIIIFPYFVLIFTIIFAISDIEYSLHVNDFSTLVVDILVGLIFFLLSCILRKLEKSALLFFTITIPLFGMFLALWVIELFNSYLYKVFGLSFFWIFFILFIFFDYYLISIRDKFSGDYIDTKSFIYIPIIIGVVIISFWLISSLGVAG